MIENRSTPHATIVPVLVYEDVQEAVEWLCDTFGFTERVRIGNNRAQLCLGDGAVIVTERRITQVHDSPDAMILRPPRRGEVSHVVMVRIDDVDSHHAHARQTGARIIEPPRDQPFGERQYSAEDLAGHRWNFSQSIADVAPEEWGGQTITD
jgi:uncharacterized glyoxalase superfamily protein PhnB